MRHCATGHAETATRKSSHRGLNRLRADADVNVHRESSLSQFHRGHFQNLPSRPSSGGRADEPHLRVASNRHLPHPTQTVTSLPKCHYEYLMCPYVLRSYMYLKSIPLPQPHYEPTKPPARPFPLDFPPLLSRCGPFGIGARTSSGRRTRSGAGETGAAKMPSRKHRRFGCYHAAFPSHKTTPSLLQPSQNRILVVEPLTQPVKSW